MATFTVQRYKKTETKTKKMQGTKYHKLSKGTSCLFTATWGGCKEKSCPIGDNGDCLN